MTDFYSNSVHLYLQNASGAIRSIQSIARNLGPGNYSSPEYAQFVESVSVKVSLFRFLELKMT